MTAAGVGVMISRTPRITVRDREVGRDVVSRDARANREQGGVRAYLGGVGRLHGGGSWGFRRYLIVRRQMSFFRHLGFLR